MTTATTTPITALELAIHRGCPEGDSISAADVMATDIPFMGGCGVCEATIACSNAYPARDGYWRCKDDIGDDGYDTAEEANADIFGN